jgi:hypothetical protein
MEKELEEKINNLFVGKTKRKVKNIVKMLNTFQHIVNLKIDVKGDLKYAIVKAYINKYDFTLPKEFLKSITKNKYFTGIITEKQGIYLTFIIPYF